MLSSESSRAAPPSGSSSPPSASDIQAARELILLLSKTARATRLYARNNELYIRFWNDLNTRMTEYLTARGPLVLSIGSQELKMGGEQVYQPRSIEDNFAFRLYKDGLRQLEFVPGLPPDELELFLNTITADFDRGELADRDVISLIWEYDFHYIKTLSVDSFAEEADEQEEEGDESAPEEEDSPLEAEADSLAHVLQQAAELKLMKLDAEERRQYHQITAGTTDFELRNALEHGAVFEIDAHAQAALNHELNATLEETPDERIADILFELFRQELPDDFPELVEITLGNIDPALGAGELSTVNTLLAPLRILSLPEYARAFLHHGHVLELFRQLGTPARLELLTAPVNEGRVVGGPAALFELISMLLPESMQNVLTWLERVNDLEMRRAVIDGLVTVAGDDLEPFRNAVRSADARLVADVIHGMGRVGDVPSLDVILGAYSHNDAKVREEVLLALRSFESPRAREIMHSALQDVAEPVRLAALRYVAVHRDRVAGRLLVDQIGGKAYRDREFAEKRAAAMAIAHIQGKEAIPALTGLLKNRKRPDLQRAAVHGLGIIGGQDVRRQLETTMREAGPDVASECRQVLPTVK